MNSSNLRRSPLDESQRRILEIATAHILPSDDGPGAREAGVMDYLEQALTHRANRHLVPLFQEGPEFLDALAEQSHGEPFLELSPEQQVLVLHEAQVYPNNDARRFFAALIELTLEGFLGDPGRGGNQDRVGWEWIGYEPPPTLTERCRPRNTAADDDES